MFIRNCAKALFLSAGALAASPAIADIRITEWMYSDGVGEYIELSNVGNTPLDMTGWAYDDDSRINTAAGGAFDLSGFGVVEPGQVVIFTETTVDTFRTAWSLPVTVKVLGGYTNNIGRNDEINIYDNTGTLVDRLAYGDQNFPGSIRTQDISGNIPLSALGGNNPLAAVASFVGDDFGSYMSSAGSIGNPGQYTVIPEPATAAIVVVGVVLATRRCHV